ncbi:uncharacterized protein LOC111601837 [Drosophila hydei]|uniref:Uncharacterized protein LOC111601837 n=1 Tax=Drosophila hydei TaxID=7224 RepID=A0A6J1M3F0_DROHY|nr:uncharacterized protein LOC111601837 [Drosophila hydei]
MCSTCRNYLKQRNRQKKPRFNAKRSHPNWQLPRMPISELKFKLTLASFFERFWRLPELAYVVMQPVRYVRKLLQEMADYRREPPHRGYWAFKPEFCMMLYLPTQ